MTNFDRPTVNPNIMKPGEFRELGPIDHWSASLPLDGITDDEFQAQIHETVTETGINFLGFKLTDKNQYVRTRYPRKNTIHLPLKNAGKVWRC